METELIREILEDEKLLETFLRGMETCPLRTPRGLGRFLETFLRGMETQEQQRYCVGQYRLETFLRGMETKLRGRFPDDSRTP